MIYSYVQYRYDDSTLSTTTSRLPFDYSRNTVRFRECLWRLWLCWCSSTNLRTPFDDSADILWRFRGHPLTIPRISSTMLRKTVNYRRGQSTDFVTFLATSTVTTVETTVMGIPISNVFRLSSYIHTLSSACCWTSTASFWFMRRRSALSLWNESLWCSHTLSLLCKQWQSAVNNSNRCSLKFKPE